MFCKNCGTENPDGEGFCKNCGFALREEVGVKKKKTVPKPVKIGLIFVSIIICVVYAIIQVIINRPVSEQTIVNDVTEDILSERNVEIEEVEVSLRETKKEEDWAIVSIKAKNDTVEYIESYDVYYRKDKKGWHLSDIENNSMDEWEVNPLTAPKTEDVIDECKQYLVNECNEEYDTFEASSTEPDIDLEGETANYYVEVKKDTPFKHISGEIKFKYEFDESSELWEIRDFEYCDSYKIDYDIIGSWYGNENSFWYGKKEYELKVTGQDNDSITAEFSDDGEVHQMTGTISSSVTSNTVDIKILEGNLDEVEETYCITGRFYEDTGEFSGTLYRTYSEGEGVKFYYGDDLSYLEMQRK